MTILFFMGCGESAGRYSVGPSELNVTDEFDSGVEEDFLGFDLSRQGDGTMDHNVAPDVTVLPPLSDFATCDPELAWMTPGTNFDIIYGTPRLSVAPDGALVARYMGGPITYYRMSDGTYLGNEGGGWDTTLTTTWKHRVELVLLSDNWFGVELRDILTGELINTIDAQPSPDPELDWLRAMEVFVSADDNLLATMTCWSRVGGDLGVARVANSERINATAIGLPFCKWRLHSREKKQE